MALKRRITRARSNSQRIASRYRCLRTQTASVVYKHNALGQRVFKSEPQSDGSGPDPAVLGADFAAWLKKNFGWLYAAGQADASVGTAYAYADESTGIPSWALMGEYDNGSASGRGRTEYIWLPVQSEAAPLSTGPQSQQLAGAIPIGFIRNNRVYAIHTDHLGTPRLVTDDDGKPIWQWLLRQAQDRLPSAFGDNAATGVLRVTTNAATAITNQPQQLRATTPQEFNLRFPGQYFDSETKLAYNYFRNYQANTGRYTQSDPIGLDGGWNRFGYVSGNALSIIDPTGEIGIGGAAFGVAVELSMQALKNYYAGCDLLDAKNYDWMDVAVSAAVGAIAPSALGAGKKAWHSKNAAQNLRDQASQARTSAKQNKLNQRASAHDAQIAEMMATQAAWQGYKAVLKELAEDPRCACKK